MSNLKDQLIRLGSDQPELRDHLRPILDTLSKKSYYDPNDPEEPPIDEWIARDSNYFLSKLKRLGLRNLEMYIGEKEETRSSHGWTLKVYTSVHLDEYSLKELADVFNSREGREAVKFRESFYPVTEKKLYDAIDEPVLLGGEIEGELEDLALIANFVWDSY